MGNGFSSPLDVCGTTSAGVNATSEFRKRRRDWEKESEASMCFLSDLLDWSTLDEDAVAEKTSQPRKRTVKKDKFETFDENGNCIPLKPESTLWYSMYITHPPLHKPKFFKKFRRRFRLPYHKFLELVDIAKEATDDDGNLYFRRWMSKDAVGTPSSPVELMILGALRYLGRGWTFDDIEESTAIDEETHRQFFHIFIKFGEEVLYKMWVTAPTTKEEVEDHMHEFGLAGMNGSFASTDATHIMWHRCSYKHRQSHMGYKMSQTARTYNLTVNHRRRILSSTQGHPARWNDKTLILHDDLARGIYEGTILSDVEFVLLEEDIAGNIVECRYKGTWLIVDNGYLPWPTTIPPFKQTANQREIRWSQWVESMRKDVECTFGILKGRWRILKAGIYLQSATSVDRVWKTCCALHNWLLEEDGLHEQWENGVRSDWEGELGEHDEEDVHADMLLPNAIQNLRTPAELRGYDLSGISFGNDVDLDIARGAMVAVGGINSDDAVAAQDGVRIVRKLSQTFFRQKLVEHFDILWRRNDLVWPQRTGLPTPHYP